MNRIVASGWEAPLYCDLAIYLDNADKVILSYKQTKELPSAVKSIEGNIYLLIVEGNKIIGFEKSE